MFKTPKPTVVFALLGTTFAALAASSLPVLAAPGCAGDLRATATELRDTPDSHQKNEAMGFYSSAISAHDNGQARECVGDLNRADTILASAPSAMYLYDAGNVGTNLDQSTTATAPGNGDHDHDHGDHGHGHH